MPTRNVNLTDHFDRFIEGGIRSGEYANASEVVRDGLRLLEQQRLEDQARIEWLRSAAAEGIADIERGNYSTVRSRAEVKRLVGGLLKRASA